MPNTEKGCGSNCRHHVLHDMRSNVYSNRTISLYLMRKQKKKILNVLS